jgi:hypothetical protein
MFFTPHPCTLIFEDAEVITGEDVTTDDNVITHAWGIMNNGIMILPFHVYDNVVCWY